MEFRDLGRQYDQLKTGIDSAISEVICSSRFISGKQVGELEKMLASYVDRKYCISCGNGTDAITIMLMSHGIGLSGGGNDKDVVFVPDFTFFSTGECPATCGATPVFVDVNPYTFNIDAIALERTVEKILYEKEYIPRAVIAVDLFGLPADYDALRKVCKKYGLLLLEDGAQGFGGKYHEKRACSFGVSSTTSFFPAKPLGCYGDGGAIFTDDDTIAEKCRSIAVHGKDMRNADSPTAKYNNVRLGMNSRLDTLQAAILIEKFKAFKEYEINDINNIALWYTDDLSTISGLILPKVPDGFYSSWAQYTIQLPDTVNRNKIQAYLKEEGIPTMVYYVRPMHKQGAFEGTISSEADCPVTEKLCDHVLCLPIYPYMTREEVEKVTKSLETALKKERK